MLRYVVLACIFLLAGCETVATRPVADLTLANVNILPLGGADGGPSHIAIRDGKIVAIVDATREPPPARRTVDGNGQYAMPGLWDMHVHALDAPWREWHFALLTANGVTAVRDMNGATPIAEAQALRRRIETGEVLGPWFLYPGPLIDAPGRSEPAANVREISTPGEARQAVRDLKESGADFIKPYNRLTPDLYFPLLNEARRLGMPVYGHVPHAISVWNAIEAGQDSIEHLGNVLESGSTDWPELQRLTIEGLRLSAAGERPPQADMERFMELRGSLTDIDVDDVARLVRLSREGGVAHTPTLVSNRVVLLSAFDSAYRRDPNLSFLPEASREAWLNVDFRRSFGTEKEDFFRRRFDSLKKVVRALHEGGVPLLAGSDAASPFVLPGFGLHQELELLVEAGLSPRAALEAATIAPTRFLGLEASRGSIETGKLADIILLEKNPFQDIGNSRSIAAVIRQGRLIDRAELNALLASAEAMARAAEEEE